MVPGIWPKTSLSETLEDFGSSEASPRPIQSMFMATLPSRKSSSDLKMSMVPVLATGGMYWIMLEVLLERLDGFRRVHDAFSLALGRLGFIPGVAAHLPDEAVDLHGREVVALAGLIGDSVEIVLGRLAGEHVALLAHEEFADIAEVVPGHGVELFARAGQLLVVLGLEVLLLFLVAEDVLAAVVHQHVGELREAVVVLRLVRDRSSRRSAGSDGST